MVKLIKLFRDLVFDYRVRMAVKKAQHEANTHRRKYLVLLQQGKPVVVSMQGVKTLIRQHRFTKGFTAETARKIALFEANPK